MTNRTIEFLFDAEEQAKMELATDPYKVDGAIGYLTQWNLGQHSYVRISMSSRDLEIAAWYYINKPEPDARGQWPRPDYAIGSVWHGDHFGFHS